jgi:hypothetical protein
MIHSLVQLHQDALCAQIAQDDIFVPLLLESGLQLEGDPWGPEYLFYTLDL